MSIAENTHKQILVDLDTIAWGVILIWWGLRWWLLSFLPNGTGLLVTGLILFGLHTARLLSGTPTKSVTITLGTIALISGGILVALTISNLHVEIPIVESALIAIGVILVGRAFRRRRE